MLEVKLPLDVKCDEVEAESVKFNCSSSSVIASNFCVLLSTLLFKISLNALILGLFTIAIVAVGASDTSVA